MEPKGEILSNMKNSFGIGIIYVVVVFMFIVVGELLGSRELGLIFGSVFWGVFYIAAIAVFFLAAAESHREKLSAPPPQTPLEPQPTESKIILPGDPRFRM